MNIKVKKVVLLLLLSAQQGNILGSDRVVPGISWLALGGLSILGLKSTYNAVICHAGTKFSSDLDSPYVQDGTRLPTTCEYRVKRNWWGIGALVSFAGAGLLWSKLNSASNRK